MYIFIHNIAPYCICICEYALIHALVLRFACGRRSWLRWSVARFDQKKSLVMNELFDLEILHQFRQYCCLKKNNRQRWPVSNSWQDVQRFKTMLVAPRCIVVMVQLSTWFSVAQGTKWKMDGKQLKSLDRIGKCLTRRTWNLRRCCFLSGDFFSPSSCYNRSPALILAPVPSFTCFL